MQLPEARKQIEDILLNLSETIVKTTIANMFETWDCAEKKSSQKLDTPKSICPDCGAVLIMQEGCAMCPNCSWSKCG